jgi:SAM-dependent methyltransferase
MSDCPFRPEPLPVWPGEESLPPLSVWTTGQRDFAAQLRDGRYVPGTETDTEQIPPALAARTITTYSHPGDLVLDPDCGAGTVLTEALHAGRHAFGLTVDSRFWTLARANITAAKRDGAWRDGSVLDASPQLLATVRAAGLLGRVGLILTTLRTSVGHGEPDSDTAMAAGLDELEAALSHSAPLLRPGGHVVVVARPRRERDGTLMDLPTRIVAAGQSAGLTPVERCVALVAGLRGDRVMTRASFAERQTAARARTAGAPTALVAHAEVIVFAPAHAAEFAAAATSAHWAAVSPRPVPLFADSLDDLGGRRAA